MIDDDRTSGSDSDTADLVRPDGADTTTDSKSASNTSDSTTSTDDGSGSDAKGEQPSGKDWEKWLGPDWREKFAAPLPDDQKPKALNWLKTRASPYEVVRSGMSADAKISELMRERVKLPNGKDDDPKDLAAYRKARGVPEDPDKYDVPVPEEFQLSELDEEFKGEFLKDAHQRHWGQHDVDFAVKSFFALERLKQAGMAQAAIRQSQAAQDDLRVEYGKEYRANIELANRMFQEGLSEYGMTDPDERREFLSKRFADGTAIGEHPAFVKMMVKLAGERADDGALVMGETSDGGDIDGRVNKIMGLMHTDPKEYARMQPELQKLIAAQNRRDGKR